MYLAIGGTHLNDAIKMGVGCKRMEVCNSERRYEYRGS